MGVLGTTIHISSKGTQMPFFGGKRQWSIQEPVHPWQANRHHLQVCSLSIGSGFLLFLFRDPPNWKTGTTKKATGPWSIDVKASCAWKYYRWLCCCFPPGRHANFYLENLRRMVDWAHLSSKMDLHPIAAALSILCILSFLNRRKVHSNCFGGSMESHGVHGLCFNKYE